MEEYTLRKTMGGYRREDVINYIDALVKKYEDQLADEREEAEAARAEAAAAAKENAKLFEKLSALEAERDSVSRAVISAQKEAEKILEEAKEKGAAILREKEQEAARVEDEMQTMRRDIHTMRLSAQAALRRYETKLGSIAGDVLDEE